MQFAWPGHLWSELQSGDLALLQFELFCCEAGILPRRHRHYCRHQDDVAFAFLTISRCFLHSSAHWRSASSWTTAWKRNCLFHCCTHIFIVAELSALDLKPSNRFECELLMFQRSGIEGFGWPTVKVFNVRSTVIGSKSILAATVAFVCK